MKQISKKQTRRFPSPQPCGERVRGFRAVFASRSSATEFHRKRNQCPSAYDRNGSTLLIVVALLGMLAFLGFVFYTFAKQERANAATFSQGAQVTKAPSIEPDAIFDFALQQIILGPSDTYYQSILWGGRHSLLANMLGRDGIPWNGEGVNLINDPNTVGQPRVDMDYNGTPDGNDALLNLIDSPAAGSGLWAGKNTALIPAPDANYNGPDINSLFLSYDGTAVGLQGANPTRVMIPSFLRPQYLRAGGLPIISPSYAQPWYNADGNGSANNTATQVMRPHPNHVCVDASGNTLYYAGSTSNPIPIPRYASLSDSTSYQALGLRRPFTLGTTAAGNYFAPEPITGQFLPNGYLGVWNGASITGTVNNITPFNTANNVTQYEHDLDVDTDGDGVLDSILMDLGYPPVRRGDGKLVVPLFAISIRDLNGLLNVNATGNLTGNLNLNPSSQQSMSQQNQLALSTNPPGTPIDQLGFRLAGSTTLPGGVLYNVAADNLSKSNQGLSTYEINILRALTADPVNDTQLLGSEAAHQLAYFLKLFDSSITSPQPGRSVVELANLELLSLIVGRPNFHLGLAQTASPLTNAITDLFPGRNGEANQTIATASATTGSVTGSVPPTVYNQGLIVSYDNAMNPGSPRFYPNAPLNTDLQPSSLSKFLFSTSPFNSPFNPYDLSKPGVSLTWSKNPSYYPNNYVLSPINASTVTPDDNWYALEGEPSQNASNRWVHPLDFRGSGQQFQRFNWGPDGQPGIAGKDDDNNGFVDDLSEEGWIYPGQTDMNGNPISDDTQATPEFLYGKHPALANLNSNPNYFPVYSGYHSYNSVGNPSFPQSSYFLPYDSHNSPAQTLPTTGGIQWGDYGTTTGFYVEYDAPATAPNPLYPLNLPNTLTPVTTSNDINNKYYFSQLMRNSDWSSLLDDPTETVIDPTVMSSTYLNYLNALAFTNEYPPATSPNPQLFAYALTMNNNSTNLSSQFVVNSLTNTIANDSAFGPEEVLPLQGSAADSRLTDSRSRLAELMPANLVASQSAPDIRKRLTSVSSDRREYGFGNATVGGNLGGQPVGHLRSWESTPQFPPTGTNGAPDPYRSELYNFLQPHQLAGFTSFGSPSPKLDVNRFLFLDQFTSPAGILFHQYGFAPLPPLISATDVNAPAAATARQNMARDIYTLLYTLGYVHTDGTNYDIDYRSVNPWNNASAQANVPSLAQAKEMAQFAVNLVDALDTDNIPTAFYYDPDLSNNSNTNGTTNGPGWDHSAYLGTGGYQQVTTTTANSNAFVVYGVERQLLAFTEACAFNVKQGSVPYNKKTIYDNTLPPTTGHTYLFFELENVSPMNVVLASSAATSSATAEWRVRLTSAGEASTYNSLYFLQGLDTNLNHLSPNPNNTTNPPVTYSPVLLAGATFSVATQDGNDTVGGAAGQYRTSDYRADPNLTGSFSLVVPQASADGTTTSANETPLPTSSTAAGSFVPRCNLDLVYNYGDGNASPSRFTLDTGSTPGSFISKLAGNTAPIRLILERRAVAGTNPANPADPNWNTSVWVPVDKTNNSAPGGTADITVPTIDPNAPTTLLLSYPRAIPLLRGSVMPAAGINGTMNTFNVSSKVTFNGGATNVDSIAWQFHNDRDFGSLSELLQLPLYGPDQLTAALAQPVTTGTALSVNPNTPALPAATKPPQVQLSISTSEFYTSTLNPDGSNAGGTLYYPSIAAARFLRPDNPDYVQNAALAGNLFFPIVNNGKVNNGNRWYRLLDLLEVPNRSHQHLAILGTPPSGAATFNTANASTNYGVPVSFANPGTPGCTSFSATNPLYTSATSSVFSGPFNLPEYFGWPRTHGLINLNMIRHPQVLSALIDDDQLIFDPRYNNLATNVLPYPAPGYPGPRYTVTPYLDDATGDGASGNVVGTSIPLVRRQWWIEFLRSRDSRFVAGAPFPIDHFVDNLLIANNITSYSPYIGPGTNAATGGLFLPGTPNGRPFRGLDVVGPLAANPNYNLSANPIVPQDSPLENTILRSLPVDSVNAFNTVSPAEPSATDSSPNVSRRLFEIGYGPSASGPTPEHYGQITDEVKDLTLHPSVRYRLMSKLMNNTTTRSNSFAVYITAQYYEAVQVSGVNSSGVSSTATRIGGRLDDAPVHRGFFVIDRTGAVDQMSTVTAMSTTANANAVNAHQAAPYPTSFPVSPNTFSFQANTDQSGSRFNQNGIRWKDLVLYRRTLN